MSALAETADLVTKLLLDAIFRAHDPSGDCIEEREKLQMVEELLREVLQERRYREADTHMPSTSPRSRSSALQKLNEDPRQTQGRTEPKGQPFLPLSQRLKKLSWCILRQTTPRLLIPTAFRDSRIDCLTPRQTLQLQILTLARIQRLSTTKNSRFHPAKWLLVPSSLPGESHAATTLKARARAWSSMLLVELAVSLV